MLGKSRKHKSVKHIRKAKSMKRKSVRHVRSQRKVKRSRSRAHKRKSSRSHKYLGLHPGVDKFLTLDENVSRARNMGWGNWSGNAAEENSMRKELNATFLKPLIDNNKEDEPMLIAQELAHLQVLRDNSNNKKSVVDDTEDIEDDIFYALTSDVFDSFRHPTPALKTDPVLLAELLKSKKYNNSGVAKVDEFFADIVKEADASSFFSSKKPRGAGTRATESAKRGVVSSVKQLGSDIVSGAKKLGAGLVSALGDGCPAGSSIDYDYTLLNPVAQKEKDCYENCDLMEVNDGLYCMPSKSSRFDSAIGKGEKNPNPAKYNKSDPFNSFPRRMRKLTMKRQEE